MVGRPVQDRRLVPYAAHETGSTRITLEQHAHVRSIRAEHVEGERPVKIASPDRLLFQLCRRGVV
jgi:hypothetical protein